MPGTAASLYFRGRVTPGTCKSVQQRLCVSAAQTQRGSFPAEGDSKGSADVKRSSGTASTSAATKGSSSDGVAFSYHSDGHYKATLEDVFGGTDPLNVAAGSAPWNMGWQTNERNVMWNNELKTRLLVVRLI